MKPCIKFVQFPKIPFIFHSKLKQNKMGTEIKEEDVRLKWHKRVLSMILERQNKKVALAVDTSTDKAPSILINNIVKLFEQIKPDTILVQADFKIRNISPVKSGIIKYFTHGKSSYTLVLEWAEQECVDTLFYITDVTGFFPEELNKVAYEVFWLVPDDFLPRVPFGKAIKVA